MAKLKKIIKRIAQPHAAVRAVQRVAAKAGAISGRRAPGNSMTQALPRKRK